MGNVSDEREKEEDSMQLFQICSSGRIIRIISRGRKYFSVLITLKKFYEEREVIEEMFLC